MNVQNGLFSTIGEHPVGAYALDGCTGTIDLSGEGNDAVISGNPAYVDGPIGDASGAISLNAVENEYNYIQILNNGSLNTRYSISISMHVLIRNEGFVLNYGDGSALSLVYLEGQLWFRPLEYLVGDTMVYQINSTITTDEWHFVVVTHDYNTLTTSMYIDGEMASSAQLVSSAMDLATVGDLFIGATATGDAPQFSGDISCLQIFDRALMVDEMMAVAMCPERK